MNSYSQSLLLGTLMSLALNNAAQAFPFRFQNPVVKSTVASIQAKSSNVFFTANFRPPNSNGLRYTIGGAVRNQDLCAADAQSASQITALVSAEESALTSKSHPQMFAVVPQLSSDKKASLIVKNDSESYYEVSSMVIPAEGGNVALSLPSSSPGLQVGEEYRWYLQIQCGETAQVEDPIVEGTISRVALDSVLANSEVDLLAFYTERGLWYDSLAQAKKLSNSGDSRYWDALVDSVRVNP